MLLAAPHVDTDHLHRSIDFEYNLLLAQKANTQLVLHCNTTNNTKPALSGAGFCIVESGPEPDVRPVGVSRCWVVK
jgi:hypothetical protein